MFKIPFIITMGYNVIELSIERKIKMQKMQQLKDYYTTLSEKKVQKLSLGLYLF